MAAAQITSNVIALAFTVIFARILGASGYGSLAVLVSAFIILMVPGSALQIAVAREVSRAFAGHGTDAGAGVRQWLKRLALGTLIVAVLAIPLRDLIAGIVNVDEVWGVAAVPVTGMLWAMLSVERGALQGFASYRVVGLTGAFLGNALALVAVGAALAVPLHRRLPPSVGGVGVRRLRDLLSQARVPVVGLTLLFALQEGHIIVVKHEAPSDAAGSYAVSAVAAKAIIWVAIGLGLYLLPEAARRANEGVDARPILSRTLGLIVLCGVPALLIFVFGGEPLLAAVFGHDLTESAEALPWLGPAMALLASTYLSVQYLLALGRPTFVWLLAGAALTEVVLLARIGADLERVAFSLFAVQLACAAAVVSLAYRTRAGE
ncbi:MAG TPA: hypothetical protein VES79_00445 [Solirubrobacteraceae bacterium]|nr:hypothetical protein [Solirubrobacteraceae bacterium]